MNTGKVLFANNATSRLYATVDAVSTSIRVMDGDGDLFPQPVGDGSNWFMVTMEDRRSNQIEICKCTGRSGDILNVARGQEGTTAQAFQYGSNVSNRMTAGMMATFFQFNGYSMDEADAKFVDAAGDSMTGPLVLPGAPTTSNEAATKQYVDDVAIDDVPNDHVAYSRKDGAWVAAAGGVEDAPVDHKPYAREDAAWVETITKAEFDSAGDSTSSAIADLDSRLTYAETVNNTQDTRLVNVESVNTTQDSRLTAIETVNTTQDSRLSAVETKNTAQDSRLTAIETVNTTQDSRLTAVETKNTAQDAAIASKLSDAPSDGLTYGRKNAAWATIVGGAVISDTPPPGPLQGGQLWWESDSGNLYLWFDDGSSQQWVQVNNVGAGGLDTSDKAPIASPTFTGEVTLPTGTAAKAPLKFPNATANPTAPVDGEIWPDSAGGGLKHRIGGVTYTYGRLEATQTWTATNTFTATNIFTGLLNIQGGGPMIKWTDTDASAYDFWAHVNSNTFYILVDRNDDGVWDGSYALQLDAQNNLAYTFGSQILTVAGGTMTGLLTGYGVYATTSDTVSSLRVQNAGTATGDTAVAALSYLCNGTFGCKTYLRSDGYYGLGGWSASAWRWYVATTTGDMVAAGNVAAYSDPRLKDDVERITDALGIIGQLDGVRFTWNDRTKLIGRPGYRDIGVLADQVEAVLPEIVGESIADDDNDGIKWRTVSYERIVPVLIEAIKELTARVNELEARA